MAIALLLFCGTAFSQTYYLSPGATVPGNLLAGTTYILEGGSSAIFYGGNINISKTAKLIIRDNVSLKMSGKITVQNGSINPTGPTTWTIQGGGSLEVSGGAKITEATPGTKWNGIEVLGKPTTSLSPPYPNNSIINLRGHVSLYDATIEYAKCGVKTAKKQGQTFINRGGIIKATSTTFLNSDTMVFIWDDAFTYLPPSGNVSPFGPFPSNGENYFVKCNFTLNNAYTPTNALGLQPAMVRVNDGYGINFLACRFSNTKYYGTTFEDRSVQAIMAYNSALNISDKYVGDVVVGNGIWQWLAPGWTSGPSSFSNFYAAIISNSFGNMRLNVEGTKFTNVSHGIFETGHQYAYIHDDTFTLSQAGGNCNSFSTPLGDQSNAIEVISSNMPFIYQNEINGLSGNNCSYGIGIADQGISPTEVKTNNIKNTRYALQSLGNNYDILNPYGGLHFSCNDLTVNNNTTSSLDISAFMGGMGLLQGYIVPVNPPLYRCPKNLFATKTGDGYNIYNDLGINLTYIWDNSLAATEPTKNHGVNLLQGDFSTVNCYAWNPYTRPAFQKAITDINTLKGNITRLLEIDSLTELQEAQLNDLNLQYYTVIDTMMSYSLYADTLGLQSDSMLLLLRAADLDYSTSITAATLQLNRGAYDDAVATINAIPGKYTLTDTESTQMNNLEDMYVILKDYYTHNAMWDSLSDTEQTQVADIMNSDHFMAGSMAKALWNMNNEDVEPRYAYAFRWREPVFDSIYSYQMPLPATNTEAALYPNPVGDLLHIRIYQYDDNKKYTLELINTLGQTVLQAAVTEANNNLSMQSVTAGLYIARVYDGIRQIAQQKIVKK